MLITKTPSVSDSKTTWTPKHKAQSTTVMSGVDEALFDRLAALPHGEHDFAWYCYAAVIFQVNDQMDLVGQTFQYVWRHTSDETEQLRIARQLREAMVKASVLVGFPKGINACTSLRKHIQASAPHLEAQLDLDRSLREPLSRADKDARGRAFFGKIYAQHTDRVLESLAVTSGGDLAEFAINAVYGDLMAEVSRLNAKETALLEFTACYATAGSSVAQAKSHMFGSRNLGNSGEEIRAAVAVCGVIEQNLGMVKERPNEQWSWLSKLDGW